MNESDVIKHVYILYTEKTVRNLIEDFSVQWESKIKDNFVV